VLDRLRVGVEAPSLLLSPALPSVLAAPRLCVLRISDPVAIVSIHHINYVSMRGGSSADFLNSEICV